MSLNWGMDPTMPTLIQQAEANYKWLGARSAREAR